MAAAGALAAAFGQRFGEPAAVPARGLRQGHRAAGGRGDAFVPAADFADPRLSGRDRRGGRAAGGHHPLSAARRGEEQSRGHRQPRAENPADEHPACAAPAAGGNGGAAESKATRAARGRPRQLGAVAGDDQQPARPGAVGTGTQQLHLRPERPTALLQSAIESFRPRAEDRGIELSVEVAGDLPPVAVDADQFQHALQNLLDNALVHTPPGGKITLSAEPADGRVVFSVADNGCGIPAQYLPMVFERYFRVPGDAAEGGSGLGLAIVREIVTAHGGTVAVRKPAGRKDRLPHDAAGLDAQESESRLDRNSSTA